MDELMARRIEKAEEFRQRGLNPYPARSTRSHSAEDAARLARESENVEVSAVDVVGRVIARRDMGRATFLDLRDDSGAIQVLLRKNALGEEVYDALKLVDLGDFLEVHGTPMVTRTGEPTVGADSWTMLAKALHAPPEKYHGLADAEMRQRQRYLDLMANEDTRALFRTRSGVVAAIRRFLDGRGFLEVETPVLQEMAGGAAAKPFVTHHNQLDEDRFLRISLELHLKKLVVGGFDKVYELGRIFRNEGTGFKYNPEFTMLETYEAYTDYIGVGDMVEQMVSSVASEVLETDAVEFRGNTINLVPPWRRITFHDDLREFGELDLENFSDAQSLEAELRTRGLDIKPSLGYGKLCDEAMSHYVEPNLIQPTFLLDYPVELSPLAKIKPGNSRLVERFEVFLGGMEV
ncbi:MAG TPA: lysine--tRNA ligase, partial [Dehalococcoidia bacterium]|nr:lysine--tRNA ligase [Dehalococcoidia bacterium]